MSKAVIYNTATSDFQKIKSVFGGRNAIAKLCRCTPSNISHWKAAGCVPLHHALALLKAAKGQLSPSDIRSDLAFN